MADFECYVCNEPLDFCQLCTHLGCVECEEHYVCENDHIVCAEQCGGDDLICCVCEDGECQYCLKLFGTQCGNCQRYFCGQYYCSQEKPRSGTCKDCGNDFCIKCYTPPGRDIEELKELPPLCWGCVNRSLIKPARTRKNESVMSPPHEEEQQQPLEKDNKVEVNQDEQTNVSMSSSEQKTKSSSPPTKRRKTAEN